MTITVVLAEDQLMVLGALSTLLGLEADITVADAMNVPLTSLGPGITLCNIVAGADCAMRRPPC